MTECKFMRQDNDRFDGEKYCTMFLAKCDSKELEFCCDDNCTVRDMAEENERLKETINIWENSAIKQTAKIVLLKQALKEIKEIADTALDKFDYSKALDETLYSILDKIEEVK